MRAAAHSRDGPRFVVPTAVSGHSTQRIGARLGPYDGGLAVTWRRRRYSCGPSRRANHPAPNHDERAASRMESQVCEAMADGPRTITRGTTRRRRRAPASPGAVAGSAASGAVPPAPWAPGTERPGGHHDMQQEGTSQRRRRTAAPPAQLVGHHGSRPTGALSQARMPRCCRGAAAFPWEMPITGERSYVV